MPRLTRPAVVCPLMLGHLQQAQQDEGDAPVEQWRVLASMQRHGAPAEQRCCSSPRISSSSEARPWDDREGSLLAGNPLQDMCWKHPLQSGAQRCKCQGELARPCRSQERRPCVQQARESPSHGTAPPPARLVRCTRCRRQGLPPAGFHAQPRAAHAQENPRSSGPAPGARLPAKPGLHRSQKRPSMPGLTLQAAWPGVQGEGQQHALWLCRHLGRNAQCIKSALHLQGLLLFHATGWPEAPPGPDTVGLHGGPPGGQRRPTTLSPVPAPSLG